MYEQALKLRKIMAEKNAPTSLAGNVKVYCVTSGKGGVGKTNLSVNMGLILQNLGKKVLIIDADLGLANIDVVSGLYPEYNLSHILSSGKSIQDVILDGPLGISILPGASGLYDLANITSIELKVLIDSFSSIANAFDIIIIDTGAGISKNVISFIRSSDEIIVVTTPEPSAVTDAYAIIKIAHKYCNYIHVIVNKTDNYKEAEQTMERLSKATKKFLNIKINYLGYVLEDKAVYKSNMAQTPFYIKYPDGLASKCLINITKKLIYGEQIPLESNLTVDGWFAKLMSFIKTNVGAI
jgi:flagellar biosynthesis protein FlhG